MKRWEWLKVVVLLLMPINAWLAILYFLNSQRQAAIQATYPEQIIKHHIVVRNYFQEKFGVKIGQKFNPPLYASRLIGSPPPLQKDFPVCFLHISGLPMPEVWEDAIKEALHASPYLYVALLFQAEWDVDLVKSMVKRFNDPRLSAIMGNWVYGILGHYEEGILVILCDGKGIVRAIEPYPKLLVSASLEKEISDWRPKLQQAVKRALEKFFRETSTRR